MVAPSYQAHPEAIEKAGAKRLRGPLPRDELVVPQIPPNARLHPQCVHGVEVPKREWLER
jgi:hypothetical protein